MHMDKIFLRSQKVVKGAVIDTFKIVLCAEERKYFSLHYYRSNSCFTQDS